MLKKGRLLELLQYFHPCGMQFDSIESLQYLGKTNILQLRNILLSDIILWFQAIECLEEYMSLPEWKWTGEGFGKVSLLPRQVSITAPTYDLFQLELEQELKKAKTIIPQMEELRSLLLLYLADESGIEIKPVLPFLRPRPWFGEGDKVEVVLGGTRYSGFVLIVKPGPSVDQVIVQLGQGVYVGGSNLIGVDSDLPTLLHEWESDYLRKHIDYAECWGDECLNYENRLDIHIETIKISEN